MGLFVLIGGVLFGGFALWLAILLLLFVLDMAYTHGLATTYMHGTSTVLQQFWSGLQAVFTVFQRILAMAPRALQVTIFLIIGLFFFGFLVNWFLAMDVVCSQDVAYKGDVTAVWIAKSLPVSDPSEVENVNVGADDLATLLNLTLVNQSGMAANVTTAEVNALSNFQIFENTLSSLFGGILSSWFVGQGNNSLVGQIAPEDTQATTVLRANSNMLANVFKTNDRGTFINYAIENDHESFKVVGDDGTVTYSCSRDGKDEVQVGLFGIQNLFSYESMLLIIVLACAVWFLKFLGVF